MGKVGRQPYFHLFGPRSQAGARGPRERWGVSPLSAFFGPRSQAGPPGPREKWGVSPLSDSSGRARRRGPGAPGKGGASAPKKESAVKPGSVVDSHSSGMRVAAQLKRPTRRPVCGPHTAATGAACLPIWSCSRWGLPCRGCCHPRGALLPHHFTLTGTACAVLRRYLSVALSVDSRPPGVTWHRALWSPDFPPCAR